MASAIDPLSPKDPGEHHRVSTTLELFLDLATVIAIAHLVGVDERHVVRFRL